MDIDLELGPSRPSLHMLSLSGGSTIAGAVSAPQSMYVTDAIEEKISPDEGYGGTRTPTFGRVMSGLHRRDTNLSGGNPSSKIWGLYLSQAAKVDKEHSDIWIGNTDSVLVFTGLFSAVVAAFLVVSYPLLQPNPTDTNNQLLTQISRQPSNGTGSSQLLSTANNSSFQIPASSVRVNILWFTSLAMSTACALCATLMQQWARRYVQVVDRPYSPLKRALLRRAFADGLDKFALTSAVEVLPALLHASFLLFYVGLVDFLIHINHSVAYIMLTWVVIGLLIYFIVTIMPLLYPNSPYQTPLSPFCWFITEATSLLWLWFRRREIYVRRRNIWQGMRRALESKAIGFTSPADAHITLLRWTLRSLDEDDKLEEFLEGLPGLFQGSGLQYSTSLRRGLEGSIKPVADKLFATCTTDDLPEKLQRQRLKTCLRAIWCFSGTTDRHFEAIWDQWDRVTNDPWGSLSTETWAVASSMTKTVSNHFALESALHAHCIQALMAIMWKKDKWKCAEPEAVALLQRQLGVSAVDIDGWLKSGDQLQLAVAANLLSKSLPLLRKLHDRSDHATRLKAILDAICSELDASDVPHELRARFIDDAEVMEVLKINLNGPWTKVINTTDMVPNPTALSSRGSQEILNMVD